jgi:uncharacterized phage-associated protein
MADAPGHDSRAVANQILSMAAERGIGLTVMQLLKLIYFAHGWFLAEFGVPLTKDKPQAWQYGPVYPLVYRNAPRSGVMISGSLVEPLSGAAVLDTFTPDEVAAMDAVVEGYGRIHAFALSQLTHKAGSPWDRAYKELGPYSVIPDEWIQDYFAGLKAA